MSARELLLETSTGPVTLAFTETLLTVRSGSTTADTPKLHSFLFSSSPAHSHSEVPIHNVIAATLSSSLVEVSYLERTGKHHFYMKQVRGDVTEKDIPLATEWCSSITEVAYKGSRTYRFGWPSPMLTPPPRRKSFKGPKGSHQSPWWPCRCLVFNESPSTDILQGKARQIFAQKVEPILRAAGCTLDVTRWSNASFSHGFAC